MYNILKYFTIVLFALVLSGCAVSMYDEDLDGIQNNKDLCLGSPKTAKVDQYGCSLDSDMDGVLNIYDKCPNTLFIDLVDSKGCKIKS